MRFQEAKKLHKGDRVKIIATGLVVDILDAWVEQDEDGKWVMIELYTPDQGYQQVVHWEVE